jgi:hypothetical protein
MTNDPFDELFEEVAHDVASGDLKKAIQNNQVRYQISPTKLEFIEQVHPDGTIITGRLQNGEFVASVSNETKSQGDDK